MKKYKVCVYAICKNESAFVDRWYESMKEADEIYVLDTGSTDNTVERLKSHNITVKQEVITPWRFEVARNKSLDMVPMDTDICVCTDLDEVFEPNWREKLEREWTDDTTRARYNYNWSLDKNNKPIVNFYIEKIHKRDNYKWTHPVHEILTSEFPEKFITIDSITLNHYPDDSKSRGSYLPLLELSVEENPTDDRNMHYLGREYMFYGKWNESIDTLIRHLSLPKATWKDERCASMRYIAKCYINLKRYDEALMWLEKATSEAPYLREPHFELGFLYYTLNKFKESKKCMEDALKIKGKSKSYLNESNCWNGTIEDIISICEYNLGNYKESLEYMKKSLELNPENKRVEDNIKIVEDLINNSTKD